MLYPLDVPLGTGPVGFLQAIEQPAEGLMANRKTVTVYANSEAEAFAPRPTRNARPKHIREGARSPAILLGIGKRISRGQPCDFCSGS